MRDRIIPLASVAVGLLAFMLTYRYLRAEHQKLAELRERIFESARKIEVVVAAQPIPQGTAIEKSDLAKKFIIESGVRGHVVTTEDAEQLLGRRTLFSIQRGDAVFWSDIEGAAGAGIGLAPMIKPGLRAISLAVAGAEAVSGMVEPNDRVDVLGTFSFPSKNVPGEMEMVTLTVLQDVTVLATGQRLAKQQSARRLSGSGGYNTVTVEVTPREAELLVFAEQVKGRLTLALRNPSDGSFEKDLPVTDFDHLQNKLPELNLYRQRKIRDKRDM